MTFWKIATAATVIMASTSANAALIERLGGLAYYDDVADLTWLADANAAGTTMNWVDANNWAADLNVAGVTGWRLASTLQQDTGCTVPSSYGLNCTGSELGNLFYNVLGGVAGSSITTTHNANYLLFDNIQVGNNGPVIYWSGTEDFGDTDLAMGFDLGIGYQSRSHKIFDSWYAWGVQSGDVANASVVPVPAAVWLFGSGLIGLVGFARRKKA